jgi:drug/metabolite transporter (DMT)-like permease
MNAPHASGARALTGTAFATLVLIATMMAANHVSARFAFNDGVDVATAVLVRSAVTALVVALIVWLAIIKPGLSTGVEPQHKKWLLTIGLLIGLQSVCLYSAVARLPVALALLAFNTYPLSAAFWDRVIYKQATEPMVLKLMPMMLIGLALALDVFGAASGLGASAHWSRIGAGVAFALAASLSFGLAMILTQRAAGTVDGRVRTVTTMTLAALVALLVIVSQGGPKLPQSMSGWYGLAALTFLYGTAFTIMFTVLPKLGVASNSAIMNVEPVIALILAWLLLNQTIAPMQLAGAFIVVGCVMTLGLRKRK